MDFHGFSWIFMDFRGPNLRQTHLSAQTKVSKKKGTSQDTKGVLGHDWDPARFLMVISGIYDITNISRLVIWWTIHHQSLLFFLEKVRKPPIFHGKIHGLQAPPWRSALPTRRLWPHAPTRPERQARWRMKQSWKMLENVGNMWKYINEDYICIYIYRSMLNSMEQKDTKESLWDIRKVQRWRHSISGDLVQRYATWAPFPFWASTQRQTTDTYILILCIRNLIIDMFSASSSPATGCSATF